MAGSSTSTLFGDQNPGLSATQLYPAVVVGNTDPEKLGRIQARVEQIFDGIPDGEIPWAIPTFGHVDGATSNSGILSIPKIGSKVLLQFQGGSPFHPMYGGYTVDRTSKLEEGDLNYPNRAVIRFKSGLIIVIDTQTNEVFFRNPGDLHALLEGNLDVTVMGNSTVRIEGNSERVVNGSSVERVKGSVTDIASGSRTELTAGSAQKFVSGTDGYYVGGNHTRVASNIYDNPGSGSPGAPAEPTQAPPIVWPGIFKGGLPRALWRVLRFW